MTDPWEEREADRLAAWRERVGPGTPEYLVYQKWLETNLQQALEALEGERNLRLAAQGILTRYLEPGEPFADQAIEELLGLFDGPRQREVEALTCIALGIEAR